MSISEFRSYKKRLDAQTIFVEIMNSEGGRTIFFLFSSWVTICEDHKKGMNEGMNEGITNFHKAQKAKLKN